MRKLIVCLIVTFCCYTSLSAQFKLDKFGKGLQLTGKDSTFYLKMGFRFQTLFTTRGDLIDDDFSTLENGESSF